MAHEQVSRHDTPFVSDSGAAGELKPTEPGLRNGGETGKSEFYQGVGSGERGLNEGRGVGAHTEHPLRATHDANIGHGHEPFSSSAVESSYVAPAGAGPETQHHKRGVGEKMKSAMKGVKDVVTGHKEKHHHQQHPEQQIESPQQHPRFTDKLKDAVTGQKPGQGAATGHATSGNVAPHGEEGYKTGFGAGTGHTGAGTGGHATSGNVVPGEEDHKTGFGAGTGTGVGTGHTGTGTGTGVGTGHTGTGTGVGTGHTGAGTGGYTAEQQKASQEHGGWPQPVPPPGIYNPNLVNPSGAPAGGHFSPHAADSPKVDYDSHRVTAGRQTAGGKIEPDAPGTGSHQSEAGSHLRDYLGAPGTGPHQSDYLENKPGYASTERSGQPGHRPGEHKDSAQGNDRAGYKPGDEVQSSSTYYPGSGASAAESNYGVSKPAGDEIRTASEDPSRFNPVRKQENEGYTPTAYPGSGGGKVGDVHSTPAAPNTRHDTPTVDNTGGATYTDTAGEVHQEGPRDDNVKKEGLMVKMMDKLHLGSNKN